MKYLNLFLVLLLMIICLLNYDKTAQLSQEESIKLFELAQNNKLDTCYKCLSFSIDAK